MSWEILFLVLKFTFNSILIQENKYSASIQTEQAHTNTATILERYITEKHQ